MLVLHSPQVIQEMALKWRQDSKIAFVPTMGCLHEGHLKLVESAKRFGQKTIVSIFVNPLQFGPTEDLDKYPRTFEDDCRSLEALDIDLLVAPSVRDLYPEGFNTRVRVDGLTQHLCGASRPGHFEGVATVCLKLFQITQAHFALFGEKDFQQLRVLQQMTQDLNLPVTIVPEPIVRENDGLAMSSRNRYLTEEQRSSAAHIPQATRRALEAASRSGATVNQVVNAAATALEATSLSIEYLHIAPERTLVPSENATLISDIPMPRLFLAVRAGQTRLIDNLSLRVPQ